MNSPAPPGPSIMGVDVYWIATLLTLVASLAVIMAIYAAVTVRDPMAKRVKALNERREQLKAGISASTAKKRAKLVRNTETTDRMRQFLLSLQVLQDDQIKVAQQRILSLTGSQSRNIRENPKTLAVVKASLNDYNLLLKIGEGLSARQLALLNALSRDGSWVETIKDGKNPFKSSAELFASLGWPDSLQKYKGALEAYERNKKMLEDRITVLEREQFEARMEKPSVLPVEHQPDVSPQNGSWSLFNWIKGIFK